MSNERTFDRAMALKRSSMNLETGEFELTLMTNGESSDTHVVDIRSLNVPPTMPMFFNHDADPVSQPGVMDFMKRVGQSSKLGGAKLQMNGRIDLEGDSAIGDVRRDVARRISLGIISQMSGRWAGGTETLRSALPKTHYAFSQIPQRGWDAPTFFEDSDMLEGSIVGLGADSQALVRCAADTSTPSHVQEFYRALVRGAIPASVMEGRGDGLEITFDHGLAMRQVELSEGTRLDVPVELAEAWEGRERIKVRGPEGENGTVELSVELVEDFAERLERIEEFITEAPASEETRPDSKEERAAGEADSRATTVEAFDVSTVLREAQERSDKLLEDEIEALKQDQLGVVTWPN